MKEIKIKVGAKGTREPVVVPGRAAENVEDMTSLAKSDVNVIMRCFNRGWRIECQERSGAREAFRANKTAEEIAKIVAGYDPTVASERGSGPRQPKVVALKPGKKSYTPDEIRALLADAGVKNVNLVDEAPAAAGAAPAKA